MSQYDFGTISPATTSGSALAAHLNAWRDALHALHKGATRPDYAVAGTLWLRDVSASLWELMLYTGAGDAMLGTINPTTGAWTLTAVGAAFAGVPSVPTDGPGAPTADGHLTRKIYVDAQIGTRVAKAGDDLTGQLRGLASAAASAPSWSFAGDTDTGIRRPAADQVAVATGGTDRLTISNSLVTSAVQLRMNSQIIDQLGNGTAAHHAVNKGQLDGAMAGVTGRLVAVRVLKGSQTYTPTAGVTAIWVRLRGGGGAGANGGAGGAGGGGGEGEG